MDGQTASPSPPADPDSDVILAAIFGGSDGNSDYVELSKHSPSSLANMPDLVGHTRKLEAMRNVSQREINAIARSTVLFFHTDELNIPELADAETDPSKTQGNPLILIVFGIGTLTLIKNLKWEIPDITKPWYADNAGALRTFTKIERYFNFLTHQGPGRGYYPKLSKSVLIVHPDNLQDKKEFRARHGFKVCIGAP